MSNGNQAATPKKTLRERAWGLLTEHWSAILGHLLAWCGTFIDPAWNLLVPLPETLQKPGIARAAVLSLLSVLFAATLSSELTSIANNARRRLFGLAVAAACAICGFVLFPALFGYFEGQWKSGDSHHFYYDVLEPFTYGMTVASLATALSLALYLGWDLLSR